MENKLVVGILNIVEDKLREFGIQIPDDDRDGSEDPIVGYQYAELHDRIQEYLEEQGLVQGREGIVAPVKQEEDLRRVCVLTCVHETRYETSIYGSVHATDNEALAHVETVMERCDFEEDKDEYFNSDIDYCVLDVSRLERVKDKDISHDQGALDERIRQAVSAAADRQYAKVERKREVDRVLKELF